jgi:hypothetical protein
MASDKHRVRIFVKHELLATISLFESKLYQLKLLSDESEPAKAFELASIVVIVDPLVFDFFSDEKSLAVEFRFKDEDEIEHLPIFF